MTGAQPDAAHHPQLRWSQALDRPGMGQQNQHGFLGPQVPAGFLTSEMTLQAQSWMSIYLDINRFRLSEIQHWR